MGTLPEPLKIHVSGASIGNSLTNTVDPEPVAMFQFSLVSSIQMMWESKTYWLAVLIVLASGIRALCQRACNAVNSVLSAAWLFHTPTHLSSRHLAVHQACHHGDHVVFANEEQGMVPFDH
jgi:hypothetical protein